MLGRIDAGGSSRALALLSVSGKTAEVRRKATETLKRRDPRDYIGLLIGMIRDPLKYEVRPGVEPGAVGEIFVEGERYNVRRLYGFNGTQMADLSSPAFIARNVPFDQSILSDPIIAQAFTTSLGPATVNVPNGHGGTFTAVNLTVAAAVATWLLPDNRPPSGSPLKSVASSWPTT